MEFIEYASKGYVAGWGIKLEFKLQDFWSGVFWKNQKDLIDIWICLVPCFPIHYWSGWRSDNY